MTIIHEFPNMDNNFYTYLYRHPVTKTPIYVGKGKNNRAYDHLKYAKTTKPAGKGRFFVKMLRFILEETGLDPIIEFLGTNIPEKEAHALEVATIALYGRVMFDEGGTLYNVTEGGEGGFTIRHTEEWKQHLRDNNAGGKAVAKQIWQIAPDGTLLKLWDSGNQAAKALKCSKGNICGRASTDKHMKVHGYFWRYDGDLDIVSGALDVSGFPEKGQQSAKTVTQKSIDGKVVRVWESMSAACRELGLHVSTISQAIKRGGPTAGYLWEK